MSKGRPRGHCNTCKCVIVECSNDGVFGDGECEGCETQRYRTQPALVAALDDLLRQTVDRALAEGVELTGGEQAARWKALAALEKAGTRGP